MKINADILIFKMTVQAISKQGKKRKQNFSSAECALLVELLEKNGYKLCICDSFKFYFSAAVVVAICLFGEKICNGTFNETVAYDGWSRVEISQNFSGNMLQCKLIVIGLF